MADKRYAAAPLISALLAVIHLLISVCKTRVDRMTIEQQAATIETLRKVQKDCDRLEECLADTRENLNRLVELKRL